MSKPKFKIGDRVKRIAHSNILSVGTVYTVSIVEPYWIGLKERKDCKGEWCPGSFELATATDLPAPTCACHANTYKDPSIEHFYFCHNYEPNKTSSDNHSRR